MNDGRDSQAGSFYQEPLNRISRSCDRARIERRPAPDAGDLPDAVLELFFYFELIQFSLGLQVIDEVRADLGKLFVQGHLVEQVGDPLGDRAGRCGDCHIISIPYV